MSVIADNLKRVQERIAGAAVACGRKPEEITLVAVSKLKPRELILDAVAAGQRVFGENRIYELPQKYEPPIEGVELHMIGHLQTNKTRTAAQYFDRIHSIDSDRMAIRLDRHLGELGRTMRGLIQVNLGLEPQKSGIGEEETLELIDQLRGLKNITIDGLMVLPPFFDDPRQGIPYFERLRELRDSLQKQDLGGIELAHLSMGMTADYPFAIAEGATMVRVGTAIFGKREHEG